MSRLIPALCFVVVELLSGCTPAATNTQNPGEAAAPIRRSPDIILADEIAISGASNALEVVTRLRPNWMRDRGTGSMAHGNITSQLIAVFLDGQRLGDVTALRMLSVTGIKSMQWLDAARAYTVLSGLGSDPISGAIVIKTR